jgi:hypothetical protein
MPSYLENIGIEHRVIEYLLLLSYNVYKVIESHQNTYKILIMVHNASFDYRMHLRGFLI